MDLNNMQRNMLCSALSHLYY